MSAEKVEQLETEAEALIESLSAEWDEARMNEEYVRMRRLGTILEQADRRWHRRYEALVVASYGEAVQP